MPAMSLNDDRSVRTRYFNLDRRAAHPRNRHGRRFGMLSGTMRPPTGIFLRYASRRRRLAVRARYRRDDLRGTSRQHPHPCRFRRGRARAHPLIAPFRASSHSLPGDKAGVQFLDSLGRRKAASGAASRRLRRVKRACTAAMGSAKMPIGPISGKGSID
jgi:hypothetical protein